MYGNELERRDDTLKMPTGRDIAGILFRHKRAVLVTFLLVLALGLYKAFTMPRYQGEMKILVRRERADPMVSPLATAPPDTSLLDRSSEEDVDSEVELLKSDDLLRRVVVALHLEDHEHAHFMSGDEAEQVKIAKAVRRLAKGLIVKPIQKTDMLAVSYRAHDPAKAQQILEKLSEFYIAKHVELHRPSGQFLFFDEQAKKFDQQLAENHRQMLELVGDPKGSVAPTEERDLSLQQGSSFLSKTNEDEAAIEGDEHRLQQLLIQRGKVAPRITTASKQADNPELLQTMKSTLLNLELKDSEMLSKFDKSYRPVTEVEREIAQTKAAIAAQQTAPVTEKTTDQNPVYGWVNSQITEVRTELAALKAKRSAERQITTSYDARTRTLAAAAIMRSDLLRDQKVLEDNYLLYSQKREEARISDALDRNGIGNVTMAELPISPALPTWPLPLLFVLCVAGATGTGIVAAFLADWLDPRFRTADELATQLGVPVLAYFPGHANSYAARRFLPSRRVFGRLIGS